MECHEGLRSKTTTGCFKCSRIFYGWFSYFCWGIFKFICQQLMKNPNLTPLVQRLTTVLHNKRWILHNNCPINVSWCLRNKLYLLGDDPRDTCHRHLSKLRQCYEGWWCKHLQYDTTSDETSNVDMHDMPDHVLSVYNSYDYHDGSFCIFSLEMFCQMSCGKCGCIPS